MGSIANPNLIKDRKARSKFRVGVRVRARDYS